MLCGVGGYVPPTVVTNADLTSRFDTSDEWIRTRTGIRERHVVSGGQATSDLAVAAGAAALKSAGLRTIDLVVLATTTPDRPCPATAPLIARQLGLADVPAFDIGAVCTGFVYGLATATGLLSAGLADSVLLIGADAFSTIVDPDDRGTAPLFGDGGGAVVLRRGTASEPGALIGFDLGSDGELTDVITVRAGGSRSPLGAGPVTADHKFSMEGKVVYRHAVRRMVASSRAVLDRAGWRPGDVDHLVGHQANRRILEAVGTELGIDPGRVVINLDRVGNTAAASIPLALADADEAGTFSPGERVLLTAFGGGVTWGSAAMTWPAMFDRKRAKQ